MSKLCDNLRESDNRRTLQAFRTGQEQARQDLKWHGKRNLDTSPEPSDFEEKAYFDGYDNVMESARKSGLIKQ